MINFKELYPGKTKEVVFIPFIVTKPLCGLLKENRPDIEFHVVMHDKISSNDDLGIARKKFCENNRCLLKNSKYEKDYPEKSFDAFISKLDALQVYKLLEHFYLEKEDKEVKDWIERQKNPALIKISPSGSDVLVLRLDYNQFEAIGEYKTLVKLDTLMKKHKLNHNDIKLVLETIMKRTPEEAANIEDDEELTGLIINDIDAFLEGNMTSAVITEDAESQRKHVIIVEPEESDFEPVILPLHNKEFKVIGTANQAADLKSFMHNKSIDEADIKLILDTVKLKY